MRTTIIAALFSLVAACGMNEARTQEVETPEEFSELMVAGGCFWCVEADLEKLAGVKDVISGYAGGDIPNPTYQNYSKNGHREVALVQYDPEEISFEKIMTVFIRTIDVTDDGGQFCDRGFGYTTAVYYGTEREQEHLEVIIANGETELGRKIVTPILAKPRFWPAEDYHQDYHMKNARRYGVYRGLCGRDNTVKAVWGQKPGDLLSSLK